MPLLGTWCTSACRTSSLPGPPAAPATARLPPLPPPALLPVPRNRPPHASAGASAVLDNASARTSLPSPYIRIPPPVLTALPLRCALAWPLDFLELAAFQFGGPGLAPVCPRGRCLPGWRPVLRNWAQPELLLVFGPVCNYPNAIQTGFWMELKNKYPWVHATGAADGFVTRVSRKMAETTSWVTVYERSTVGRVKHGEYLPGKCMPDLADQRSWFAWYS